MCPELQPVYRACPRSLGTLYPSMALRLDEGSRGGSRGRYHRLHMGRCLRQALVERLFQAAPQDSALGHALLQVAMGHYRISRSTRCDPRPCTFDATASV